MDGKENKIGRSINGRLTKILLAAAGMLLLAALTWGAVALIDTRQEVAVISGNRFTDEDGYRLEVADKQLQQQIADIREDLAGLVPALENMTETTKETNKELRGLKEHLDQLARQIDKLDNRVAMELGNK